jgi:uncharacterized membrane protein
MTDFVNFIQLIWSLVTAWRVSICLLVGLLVGYFVGFSPDAGRLRAILGLLVLAGFVFVGIRWDLAALGPRPRA